MSAPEPRGLHPCIRRTKGKLFLRPRHVDIWFAAHQLHEAVMTHDLDLLGAPVMQRSADFATPTIRRTLSRKWSPGPRALVIGCNPSEAGIDRDDQTSLWWNAWFQLFGFGAYDAANLYPFVTSDPRACRRRVEEAFGGEWHDRDALLANVDHIVALAKAADQVFVCWGNIAWDDFWIDHVVEQISTGVEPYPDLWCWGKNGNGSPKHPASRGVHRIPRDQQPILWRAAST